MIKLEDKLYTSSEVAEILGVSLRSVYRYIEEDKLIPDVKTATGRHRFTKQNILDFLYPSHTGQHEMEDKDEVAKVESREPRVASAAARGRTQVAPKVSAAEEEKEQVETPQEKPEEPVDWLAKFREAARKFREEQEEEEKKKTTVEEQEPSPSLKVEEPKVKYSAKPAFEEEESFTGLSGLPKDEPARDKEPAVSFKYYRSGLGGLKDIAQNIDKKARAADLDYVFTLHAGLSLFKPIKPFSTLHAYIKSKDRDYFEKALVLTPSEEGYAQLCFLVTDEHTVYDTKDEMHGLYVVSKSRLKTDIEAFGEEALKSEAASILE
jgi:DNA-binding transcriptional MerR regulator